MTEREKAIDDLVKAVKTAVVDQGFYETYQASAIEVIRRARPELPMVFVEFAAALMKEAFMVGVSTGATETISIAEGMKAQELMSTIGPSVIPS